MAPSHNQGLLYQKLAKVVPPYRAWEQPYRARASTFRNGHPCGGVWESLLLKRGASHLPDLAFASYHVFAKERLEEW